MAAVEREEHVQTPCKGLKECDGTVTAALCYRSLALV